MACTRSSARGRRKARGRWSSRPTRVRTTSRRQWSSWGPTGRSRLSGCPRCSGPAGRSRRRFPWTRSTRRCGPARRRSPPSPDQGVVFAGRRERGEVRLGAGPTFGSRGIEPLPSPISLFSARGLTFPHVSGGVVVTGASSGIGAAIARDLAARSFRVFGTVRREQDGPPLEAAHVVPVLMDVTDAASIARARDEVSRALAGAPLAGLVNNAGIPSAGPLELVPLDQLPRVLEVNLVGAVAVTQAFLPLLKAARGRIVNISSVAGRRALPFLGPYPAPEYALEGASHSLPGAARPLRVRVIVVQPGSVQSRIWEKVERWDLSRYRGTPYERVLERFRDLALRSGQRGLPAERVAHAVAKALTARRPPLRILVVESALGYRLMELLPDRLMDWLIERVLWKNAASGR